MNKYLYNNEKLNPYGIDDITDFDKVLMATNNHNNSSINNNYYEYVINKYDINIVVNENNTFDVTEKIIAYFNKPKHGIFRTIPLKNEITRLDGTVSKKNAQITNLSVDKEYTTTRENGNYKIKIGSSNTTLTGEQTYKIKYTYNLGKDPLKDKDELYYNIIGTEWDTTINNVTFSIHMPKDFDSSKLGFSSGQKGSIDSGKIKYTVNGNTIKGSYNDILNPNEALTVRCELEEGYFVGAGFERSPYISFMFIIPILGLVISFILWYKYGRDEKVVETVEFYPPKGLNSLEVGFLYKGKAGNKDVISLLIYLANKGYIKIAEIEENSLFGKTKDFKITKLKEYDGDNINEEIFFKGLFSRRQNVSFMTVIETRNEALEKKEKLSYKEASIRANLKHYDNSLSSVTSSDLYNKFYYTTSRILSNINTKTNKNKIFEIGASGKSFITVIALIISMITMIVGFTLEFAIVEWLDTTLFVSIPIFLVIVFSKESIIYKILLFVSIVFAFYIVGFMMLIPSFDIINNNYLFLSGLIINVICLIGMVIFFKLMPKRTKYGIEMLGKIKGFKNFLETAEKEKLETLVLQDPEYFYNILPYTYVLGVSNTWIKKFETISLQAPDWYDSSNAFDMVVFSSFMHNTMSSAQSSMSSSPSSSSGGSSGGGSSGGGSGGGGGSW